MQRKSLHRFVVCVRNDGHPVDLELRKIYRSIGDRDAEVHGMVRVVDESGEDYLYPAAYFRSIRIPPSVLAALRFGARRAAKKCMKLRRNGNPRGLATQKESRRSSRT